jgi:hypothetical protein
VTLFLTGCVAAGLVCLVSFAWTLAAVVTAPLAATLGMNAWRSIVAGAARRTRRDTCPFENDDDAARPLAAEVADVVVESAVLVGLVLAGLFPSPLAWRAPLTAGAAPLVVLLPEWGLPLASLTALGRRLERALGADVRLEPRRHPWTSIAARAERLADFVAAARALAPARPLLLVGHGAGGLVARRAAVAAPGARVVTLATAHEASAGAAADTLSIYSLHDPFVTPPERAYLAGGFNVALRDAGHFRIVSTPRPAEIVVENLDDLVPHAVAS